MIERLPTPWGLVRLGVAPDHPNIKAVSRAFEKTALQPGFRFFGNVEVGRDVDARRARAPLRRRRLHRRRADRPAARDPGRGSARLVGRDRVRRLVQRPPGLPGPLVRPDGERAVVIGNGNVALDVARMLALTPEELAPTDTTDAGDRGDQRARDPRDPGGRPPRPRAGGVTTPVEVGELGELAGADILVDPADLELDPASEAELADGRAHRAPQRRASARVRGARADGQAARDPAPLPPLAGRDPRRRAGRGDRARAERARGRTGARPCRPTSARRSRAASSSGASATTASPCRASRSTSDAGRSRTRAAA